MRAAIDAGNATAGSSAFADFRLAAHMRQLCCGLLPFTVVVVGGSISIFHVASEHGTSQSWKYPIWLNDRGDS